MNALGFGLPLAALLAVAGYGANRLLRAGARRGWVNDPRAYVRLHGGAAIGNALLELHVVLEPQRDRIETPLRLEVEDEDGISDGRRPPRGVPHDANVIRIDFVQKRRR